MTWPAVYGWPCLKAFALPKGVWVICGVQGMRKKSDGPGEMVSAWQDDRRGFGLDMGQDELDKVNVYRATMNKAPLEWSPGVRWLEYGVNKDGHWCYEDLEEQAMDVLDVLECLYPECQVVMEVDHSAGHGRLQPDRFNEKAMGMKIGGMHTTPHPGEGSRLTKVGPYRTIKSNIYSPDLCSIFLSRTFRYL